MNSTLTKIVDIFIVELKKLYFNRQKRATAIAKFEEHLVKGTFPADLNFNINPYQLPATIEPTEIATFRSNEAHMIRQFKLQMLNQRKEILSTNLTRMIEKSENFYDSENLNQILGKILPAEQIEGLAEHYEVIVKETKLQFALFVSEFERRKNVANLASHFQAMQVQESTTDLQKVLEELGQLKKKCDSLEKQKNKNRTTDRSWRERGQQFGDANARGRPHTYGNKNRGRSPSPRGRSKSPSRQRSTPTSFQQGRRSPSPHKNNHNHQWKQSHSKSPKRKYSPSNRPIHAQGGRGRGNPHNNRQGTPRR